MRKTIAAMLAGILSFGAVNSHAQSQASVEEMAAVVKKHQYEAIIRNETTSMSPLEQISAYDILPALYAFELKSSVGIGSFTPSSSMASAISYSALNTSINGAVRGGIPPTPDKDNTYVGYQIFSDSFAGNINVILNNNTAKLVGNINGKGIEITYAPNGQISGFYGDLRAQGKVVAYDKNHLPKRIVVQLGPYIYEQNATYKDGVISGHEAKRVDGKSLETLIAASK